MERNLLISYIRWKRFWFLASVFAFCLGCGKSTTQSDGEDAWRFEDKGKQVKQGRYRVEVDVRRDECTPSLRELMKTPGHPPNDALFALTNPAGGAGEDFEDLSLRIITLFIRVGTWNAIGTARVNDAGVPLSYPLFDRKAPGPKRAPWGFKCTRPYPVSHARVTSPTPDTLRAVVRTNWQNVDRCKPKFTDDREWQKYAYPDDDCREKFVVKYKLKEQCPVEKRCQLDVNVRGRGCPYTHMGKPECEFFKPPLSEVDDLCVCEDGN